MGILVWLLVFWLFLLIVSIIAQYGLRDRGVLMADVCALLLFLIPVIPLWLAGFLVSVKSVFGDAPPLFLLRYFIVTGAKGPMLGVSCFAVAPQLGFWAFFSWRASRLGTHVQECEHCKRPARWPDYVIVLGVALFVLTTWYLRGYTTLEEAVREGDVDLVKRRLSFNLLGLGMENGRVGEVSYMLFLDPILPLAVGTGNQEVVSLLFENGAPKDWCLVQGPEGAGVELLLDSPVRFGQTEMLRFLLEQGSRPNAKDAGGNTLLHIAAREDRADAAALLLRYGADASLTNAEGLTPLGVARKEGSDDVISLLTRRMRKPSDAAEPMKDHSVP